jgi:hypothetical protein
MTLFVYYESALTPISVPFSVDVSSAVRLGSITGISQEAESGAVGAGSIILDDPNSDIGFFADGIRGLKSWRMIETAAPVGSQLLFIGYVGSRTYRRNFSESLILGVNREIDVELFDINAFLSFRVFAPTALDPTSDFVRPAETDLQRIAALLTTVDFLSDTLFDIGYIPTTGGVAMDANDYTGSRPVDVLNDCAQASGRNFFIIYSEALTKPVLWYDSPSTDGTSTIPYDSPLSLTNVASEANANATILLNAFPGDTTVTLAWSVVAGATTFIVDEGAEETLDPSRVISAEYLTYTGGVSYQTLPGTASNFAWRDGQPLTSSVKTSTKADALANRYLADNATEDSRITLSVQLPSSAVTLLNAGMRVQVHLTHCPSVASGMTWCRVLQRTIRMDHLTNDWYWLDLELSPPTVTPPVQNFLLAYYAGSGDGSPIDASSHPWTQVWANNNIGATSVIGGGAGPPTHQSASMWVRPIVAGESSTVALFTGSGNNSGIWVYEIAGCALSGITSTHSAQFLADAGTITVAQAVTSNSLLIGGFSFAKVDYDAGWGPTSRTDAWAAGGTQGALLTAPTGTALLGAGAGSNQLQNGSDVPWTWLGYATGTGTLTIGVTANSHGDGSNAYIAGYNVGKGGIIVPLIGNFSVVQSASGASSIVNGTITVTLPSPPSP